MPSKKKSSRGFTQILPFTEELHASRIILKRLGKKHAVELIDLFKTNRRWLKPYLPEIPQNLSLPTMHKFLLFGRTEAGAARRLELGIFFGETRQLIGIVTLHSIVWGISLSAGLGFWIDRTFAGTGLMTEAVATLISFAFEETGLHRIWSSVQEKNLPSRRIFEKLEFSYEGTHRKELFIDGKWRNQQHFSLLREEYDRLAEKWIEKRWLGTPR